MILIITHIDRYHCDVVPIIWRRGTELKEAGAFSVPLPADVPKLPGPSQAGAHRPRPSQAGDRVGLALCNML